MRVPVILVAVLALTACDTSAPSSASGPGFTDYNAYLNQRTAVATQAPLQATAPTGFSTDAISGAIDSAESGTTGAPLNAIQTGAVIGETARPRGDAPTTIQQETGEVDAFVNAGVSDEQDFQAVAARETIASDAARIEVNRSQYVVIQPGSLPTRPGDVGPNIVEFALATTNPVGVALYKRSSVSLNNSAKACLKYASPDLAQQALLANGGPESDRKNLDPDGDGFACGWDPTSFRIALR